MEIGRHENRVWTHMFCPAIPRSGRWCAPTARGLEVPVVGTLTRGCASRW